MSWLKFVDSIAYSTYVFFNDQHLLSKQRKNDQDLSSVNGHACENVSVSDNLHF